MSTRSYIGYKTKDGSVNYIYCHWDGYPSNNGKILFNHYKCAKKVKKLVALGDLSSLGSTLEECVTSNSGVVNSSNDHDYLISPSVSDYGWAGSWIDYRYLYVGGKWLFNSQSRLDEFVELTTLDIES